MNLITPELKDAVLKELIDSCPVDTLQFVNRCQLADKLNTTKETITGILYQFSRMGLCSAKDDSISCDINIILNVEAHDMVCRGGFVAKEQVLKQELKKLTLEIGHLKTKDMEQATRLTTIVSNIASFFKIII